MDLTVRDHHPVELAADAVAATAMAAAIGYAASAIFQLPPIPGALAAFAGVIFGLRRVAGTPKERSLPDFNLEDLPEAEPEPEELVLTPDMVLRPPAAEPSEVLVLDDVLAELSPDSRVVRLFDARQMITPGELKADIDRHLRSASSVSSPSDATQALSDALAQLRRSLR